MNRIAITLALLVGCVDDPPIELTSTAEAQLCNDCEPILPRCNDVCDTSEDCNTGCRALDNTETTCGDLGVCQSCSSTCGATADCSAACLAGGAVTTCEARNSCQRYDVYCAFPTITSSEVSSTHESVTSLAYMYYGSAIDPKSGAVPRLIDGRPMTTDTWASNFRGPIKHAGPVRTQWEWTNDDPYGMFASFGPYGAPYTYGRECTAVPRTGKTIAPVPALTVKRESVYEDDECLEEVIGVPGTGGICNDDDLVGHFWIDRGGCNTSVFGKGLGAGWTNPALAATDGSISRVRYRLYCYSCKNASSPSCSAGVVY